jgi:amino acid adenylation domain-containing protein
MGHHLLTAETGQRPDTRATNTIAPLFDAQAARTPDAIAVGTGDTHLTYRGLSERVNRLARHLQAAGVGPETVVGLAVERNQEMLVAMLAILKAGGAYLPLDPEYPKELVALVVEDSQTKIIVSTESTRPSLPATAARVISLDGEAQWIAQQSAAPLACPANGENLAYLMYTSGSTGKPKGVMVENRNVVNFFHGMDHVIGPERGVWLAVTSISFDISVLELLWTVTRGFQVVIRSPKDTLDIPTEIVRHGVTHYQSTPTPVRALVSDPKALAAFGRLKKLLLGGEAVPACLVRVLRAQYQGEIYNMYGPTETTIWSTSCRIEGFPDSLPIGKAMLNQQAYVLDERLRPVAPGESGELFIGGDGVGRGYWNRPELTQQRFVPDPLREGGRLYRTGDAARVGPDGNLEFLGRTDFQVKIRGYRIELGGIEALLEQQAGVQQAVAAAHDDAGGDKILVAYVVPKNGPVAPEMLRAALQEKIPDYMVPSRFVFLNQLPLTANGKIDRLALLESAVQDRPAEREGDDLDGEIEQIVAQIWAEALGVLEVRRNDSFFDLGGHSLSALKTTSQIQEVFQVNFPLQTFVKMPVLCEQARMLEEMLLNQAEA